LPGLTTAEVARHLRRLATLLEYHGESHFRFRAFQTAADAIEAAAVTLEEVHGQSEGLEGVKGIGRSIAAEIRELEQGSSNSLLELSKGVPSGLFQWLEISGLGIKKARVLSEQLGLDTMEDFEAALKDGRVAKLPGFGEKSVKKLQAGIDQLRLHQGRHLVHVATVAVEGILESLASTPGLIRLEAAGSLRRGRETVGDADLVASTDSAESAETLMKAFISLSGVVTVLGQGLTKSSVVLSDGLQVDLRVVPDREFPAALAHFTGSKEHNIALRKRALARGYRLNEYGLFRDSAAEKADVEERRAQRIASAKAGGAVTVVEAQQEAARSGEALDIPDEAALHKALGLHYIPPELREDQGEIEAAEAGNLPMLVSRSDYRGVLHCHTTASDGANSLREMVFAARDHWGLKYYGTADHSQSAAYAGGLKPAALLRQIAEVEELQKELDDSRGTPPFLVFKGTESDILRDGSLDYPNDILERLDYVVASVHSHLTMDADEATQRLLAAIRNPFTTILGHPSGRLLLRRDGYPYRVDEVLELAAETGTFIEINASPMRLDLDWRIARRALDMGVRFAINPDAHSVAGLGDIRYGLSVARKAWIPPERVLNCLPAEDARRAMVELRERKKRLLRP
jgi:DNA polymerase (family 10)